MNACILLGVQPGQHHHHACKDASTFSGFWHVWHVHTAALEKQTAEQGLCHATHEDTAW